MCRRKPWKKWTAMYWFAHKAYWAVIRGWIRQCMKWLENWLLSGSEILLVAFPYILFPFTFHPFSNTFPNVSPIDCAGFFLGISHVFPGISSCPYGPKIKMSTSDTVPTSGPSIGKLQAKFMKCPNFFIVNLELILFAGYFSEHCLTSQSWKRNVGFYFLTRIWIISSYSKRFWISQTFSLLQLSENCEC